MNRKASLGTQTLEANAKRHDTDIPLWKDVTEEQIGIEHVNDSIPLRIPPYDAMMIDPDPDRELFLITNSCSISFRQCTRRRFSGQVGHSVPKQQLDQTIEYMRMTPKLRGALFSAGLKRGVRRG